MTAFDTLFNASARDALKADYGEIVTYVAPDKTETDVTALVMGEERRPESGDRGSEVRREQPVSFFKSDLAAVSLEGQVKRGGETWTIDEVLAETGSQTAVQLVRMESAERARQDFRGG